jgi:signal transduction histidine kinase
LEQVPDAQLQKSNTLRDSCRFFVPFPRMLWLEYLQQELLEGHSLTQGREHSGPMESDRLSNSIDHSGSPKGTAGLGMESDQLQRLATLGAHSAGLAHELKNALVPVKTMLQLLLQRHPDAELGEMANRELARMDSLVSQMLLMSSPTPTHLEQVHLHELLEYTLRLLQTHIEGKRIHVKNVWTARDDGVLGNSYQLQQAVMNLVLNAIDSMEPGGILTLATQNIPPQSRGRSSPQSGRLSLEVSDFGCGIPAENLARLFEPFFTTKKAGTGLGLHITKRIVTEHQGSISVESMLGKGTTFTVVLP